MKITKTLLYKSGTLWVTINSNKHPYITTKRVGWKIDYNDRKQGSTGTAFLAGTATGTGEKCRD